MKLYILSALTVIMLAIGFASCDSGDDGKAAAAKAELETNCNKSIQDAKLGTKSINDKWTVEECGKVEKKCWAVIKDCNPK